MLGAFVSMFNAAADTVSFTPQCPATRVSINTLQASSVVSVKISIREHAPRYQSELHQLVPCVLQSQVAHLTAASQVRLAVL